MPLLGYKHTRHQYRTSVAACPKLIRDRSLAACRRSMKCPHLSLVEVAIRLLVSPNGARSVSRIKERGRTGASHSLQLFLLAPLLLLKIEPYPMSVPGTTEEAPWRRRQRDVPD
eukprot:911533-Rhodomonas_salina.6